MSFRLFGLGAGNRVVNLNMVSSLVFGQNEYAVVPSRPLVLLVVVVSLD